MFKFHTLTAAALPTLGVVTTLTPFPHELRMALHSARADIVTQLEWNDLACAFVGWFVTFAIIGTHCSLRANQQVLSQ